MAPSFASIMTLTFLNAAVLLSLIRTNTSFITRIFHSSRISLSSKSLHNGAHFGTGGFVEKPKAIFVLGGPGAGKGTQCEKLSKEFGMVHLSAGELLRKECASGSENGKLIENYLKEGKIVPVEITINLLKKEMLTNQNNRFLIDGFPRNKDNYEGWERVVGNECEVEAVVFIDCPEEVLIDRLLARGKTSGRSDDNITSAKKRIETFRSETMPIITLYDQLGSLIRVVGSQSVESVYIDICKSIKPLICNELIQRTKSLLNALTNGNHKAYDTLSYSDVSSFTPESLVNIK